MKRSAQLAFVLFVAVVLAGLATAVPAAIHRVGAAPVAALLLLAPVTLFSTMFAGCRVPVPARVRVRR